MQTDEIFSEASSRKYRELGGPDGVVLRLQQVIHEVSVDSGFRNTISEHQASIQEIVHEIFRLREEMAKFKLTLKQAFMTIDENCGRQVQALTGSFAGTQLGVNEGLHKILGRFLGQLSSLKFQTEKMAKDLDLDWRAQSAEEDYLNCNSLPVQVTLQHWTK